MTEEKQYKRRGYTITGHMVVKNEDRWIWFSIMSVIDFVDKLYVYDTGSRDKTKKIIETVINSCAEYKNKITYKEMSNVHYKSFYSIRQDQISNTDTDYFMVIDGDEIWWDKSLHEIDELIKNSRPLLIATRFINCCGDVFHYRNSSRETYSIAGIIGNITIRVYSMKINGIACSGEYGKEGFVDSTGEMVQSRGYEIKVMDNPYLHMSLLNRSSRQLGDYFVIYRKDKLHTHWDAEFPENFKYPEVFYEDRPKIVRDPFKKDYNILHNMFNMWHVFKGIIKG